MTQSRQEQNLLRHLRELYDAVTAYHGVHTEARGCRLCKAMAKTDLLLRKPGNHHPVGVTIQEES